MDNYQPPQKIETTENYYEFILWLFLEDKLVRVLHQEHNINYCNFRISTISLKVRWQLIDRANHLFLKN